MAGQSADEGRDGGKGNRPRDNLLQAAVIALCVVGWSVYFLMNQSFASPKFDLIYGCIFGLVSGLIVAGTVVYVLRTVRRRDR